MKILTSIKYFFFHYFRSPRFRPKNIAIWAEVKVPETARSAMTAFFLEGMELIWSSFASRTSKIPAPITAKNPIADAKLQVDALEP